MGWTRVGCRIWKCMHGRCGKCSCRFDQRRTLDGHSSWPGSARGDSRGGSSRGTSWRTSDQGAFGKDGHRRHFSVQHRQYWRAWDDASSAAMRNCDTLLIAGSTMPFLHYYPKPGQARIVQIDRDPTRLGLRVAVDVRIVGDVRRYADRLTATARTANRSYFSRTNPG